MGRLLSGNHHIDSKEAHDLRRRHSCHRGTRAIHNDRPGTPAQPIPEIIMTERFPAIRITMLPRDTNAYGTVFGGVILSYIDLAGGIEARRQSPKKFVTKAMREVVFVAPVFLGDLVTFYTRTIKCGRTSITVEVQVAV